MIIIGNLKSYLSNPKQLDDISRAANQIVKKTKHTLVLAPSFVGLGYLSTKKNAYELAAQDISIYESGAHTGEVNPQTLKNYGAGYVIVGHSERRAMGESNSLIAQKVQQIIGNNLKPVICIGEEERTAHATHLAYITEQITTALDGLRPKDFNKVSLAYEPIWAISTHGSSTIQPHDLEETVLFIRKILNEHFGDFAARKVKILYGGSVSSETIEPLLVPGIDGFLVGSASRDPDSLKALFATLST